MGLVTESTQEGILSEVQRDLPGIIDFLLVVETDIPLGLEIDTLVDLETEIVVDFISVVGILDLPELTLDFLVVVETDLVTDDTANFGNSAS